MLTMSERGKLGRMTPIERQMGRYMRAPDHSDGDGGGDGGAPAFGDDGDAGGGAGGAGGEGDQNGGEDQGGGDRPDWLKGFSAEAIDADNPSHQDWLAAKGFKTLDDVVKSYRDTERAFRAGDKVVIPKEGASAEEIAAYHRKIGVPEKPDDYTARPTNVSPYYFGNAPAFPVYRGVPLTKSNLTLVGYGATIHVKSRTAVTASEVQPIFATDKNMTIGTAEDIGFVGLRFDPENDADAVNSNQRFAYMVGVRGLRYLHTRAKSSGLRRGYFSHIQNSENILINEHYHRKVTGGYNLRYCENVVIANSIFDDFSEAIDFDSTGWRVAGGNLVFRSTSRVNQALDINSVQDMALGSIAVHNLGNIFTINYKTTTPPTFDEYVNQPTYVGPPFVPTKNVILSDIVGSAIGNGSAIAGGIGWDWSAGSHIGEGPVRDITLNGSRINDTWLLACNEARGLVVKDYHWRDVLSPATFAAFDFRSQGANSDQIAWSDLEVEVLDCSLIGTQRGALSISSAKRAVVRNFLQRSGNTLGGSEDAFQLTNLQIRGARVNVSAVDIEGNVRINGSTAGIAAWAADTAYP